MKSTLYAIRLIFLSFGLAISSWAPIIPLVKSRLNFDDGELGLVLLVLGIGALLSMPFTGWIISKLGSRLIVLVSGIATVATLPILAIVPTTLTLCFTLFIFGIVSGAMNVSMNAQAVDIENASGLPILSGIHGCFSIGGLFGPIIIGLLLKFEIPIFYCVLTISSVILLILLTQCHHLLKSEKQRKSLNKPSTKGLFLHRGTLILGLLCFIAFMAEGSMLDWSAEYLYSNLNYNIAIAGIGYSVFSIAMAVGRFFGDRVIKKLGSQLVFQLGCLVAATGFATIITSFWTHWEIFGFILIGIGASNTVPIIFSSSGKLPNISSNTALTVVTTCGYIGLLIGPAFIGILAEVTSLSLSFLMIALSLVVLCVYGRNAIKPTLVSDSVFN